MFNIQQFRKIFYFGVKYAFSLFCLPYLFTVGLLFSKNRTLLNQIYSHFSSFRSPRLIIPKIQLSKIIKIGENKVCIAEPLSVKGNVTLFELLILNLFVKAFNPKTIFELGTFNGRTTLNLAINSCPDARVYTIDLPKDNVISSALPVARGDRKYLNQDVTGVKFLNKKEKSKITQLYGDTATFDFTPHLNTTDMIFIDGSHSFEYVLNDSKIALKLLREGHGLIVWHDYNSFHKGVVKALNKLQLANPEFKMFYLEDTSLVYLIR